MTNNLIVICNGYDYRKYGRWCDVVDPQENKGLTIDQASRIYQSTRKN